MNPSPSFSAMRGLRKSPSDLNEEPTPTAASLLVVGISAVGKTTLVRQLQTASNRKQAEFHTTCGM
jgi:GTPase SAR1 family protein